MIPFKDYTTFADRCLDSWVEGGDPLHLTVEAGDSGFSFAVSREGGDGRRLAAGYVPVFLGGSARRVLEKAIRFFETVKPFSGLRFARTSLVYLDRRFTLLPGELFEQRRQADLLGFALGRVIEGRIAHREIPEAGAVCVFSCREDLLQYFSGRSARVEEHHGMEVFLRLAMGNAPEGRSIHVNALQSHILVAVVEDGRLVLGNAFRMGKYGDLLYYPLLCANQTGCGGASARFVFYGQPEIYQPYMDRIAEYLPDHRFACREESLVFSPALDFVAGYDCYDVLNAVL